MRAPTKELCVVHLVRAHNGIDPFKRFLESYQANPGGIEHDLLFVFKGFAQPRDTAEYLELLAPIRYATFQVSDEGFDITAYFSVVKRYSEQYRYFCFLNSYSIILDRDWLKKLHENICKPGVGLAGATGSWGNQNRYQNIFELPTVVPQKKKRPLYKALLLPLVIFTLRLRQAIRDMPIRISVRISFDPFPSCHIRTNAFMISGELMKTLKRPSMKTKMDAYRFESGRKGLTSQILAMGKRVIVVGKDGRGYEKEEWRESRTFWRYEQENLLIADNQTRDYQEGSSERRRYLSDFAWGETDGGSGIG